MAQGSTTIRINRDPWQRLHALKEPGVSHDDIIQDLLDAREDRLEAQADS